jgi:hypothetical protein
MLREHEFVIAIDASEKGCTFHNRMPLEMTRYCPSGNNTFQLRGMCFNSALEQASKTSNAPSMSAMEEWVNDSALSANPSPKNAFVTPVCPGLPFLPFAFQYCILA